MLAVWTVLGTAVCLSAAAAAEAPGPEAAPDQEAAPDPALAQPPPDNGHRVSYKGAQLLWICPGSNSNVSDRQALSHLVKEAEHWGQNETCWQYLVPGAKAAEVKQKLHTAGVPYSVTIEDLQRAIDAENPSLPPEESSGLDGKTGRTWTVINSIWRPMKGSATQHPKPLSPSKGHKMTWNAYHRLSDINGYLDYLGRYHSDIVSVGSLGTSVEGRPIKYVKISSGKPNAKSFWIDGGIHAREWISPATVTYIINEMVFSRDQHAKELDGIDFYILPVLNPDGYEYTHTRDRLWRKNRSKGGYYCQGTDLNRNWGYRWGGKGASNQQCQEIYGGKGAFSEPETAAVSRFILQSVPNRKAFVTFHSYGQYILYPFGYDNNQLPQDYADLDRVGRKAAEAIRQVGGSHYTVGNSASTLYPASGGADDWAKGVGGFKYSYTIELRDTGRYGFVLPAQFIKPTGQESFAAIKAIAAELQNLS